MVPWNAARVGRDPIRRSVLLTAAALGVWLAGLLRFRSWRANDDLAILQLHAERLAQDDIRLLGAYSRFGFHHPGPLREWTVGAGYWLSGSRAAALPTMALAINLAAVVLALVAARRALGTRGLVAAAVSLSLTQIGLGAQLHSAWNPHLAVLAGAATAWGVVAVLTDGARNWWLVVVPGSLLAQLHVSGLVTLALALSALAVVLVRSRDLRRLAWASVTMVVLWIGPLIDLAGGSDSNLVAFLDRSSGTTQRVGDAAAASARLITPWSLAAGDVAGQEVAQAAPLQALLIGILFAGSVIVLRHHHRRRVVPIVGAVAGVSMFLLATQLVTPVFGYLWAPLVGPTTLVTASIVLGVITVLETRGLVFRPPTFAAASIAPLSVAVAVGVSIVGWWSLAPIETASLQRTIEARVPTVVANGGTYAIHFAEMNLSLAHAEVALAVQQAGANPVSDIFELDLPSPGPDDPVLVTAMGAALDCLTANLAPTTLVLRHPSQATGLDVGVFLVDADADAGALTACGVR